MANFILTSGGSRLEVTDADECDTIADAIALFRDTLNIPESPVALVNGEPVDDFSTTPPDGSEVALNKPAGQKG